MKDDESQKKEPVNMVTLLSQSGLNPAQHWHWEVIQDAFGPESTSFLFKLQPLSSVKLISNSTIGKHVLM